jgi:hypothetical protein
MDRFFALVLDEIVSLLTVSDIIIYSLLSVNLMLITFISFIVLRNVNSVFPTCQHCLVGGNLVHSLPFGVCNKILRFYMACEKSLAAIEDEDEAKKNIEQQGEVSEDDEIREDQGERMRSPASPCKLRELDSGSKSDGSDADDFARLDVNSIELTVVESAGDPLLSQCGKARHSRLRASAAGPGQRRSPGHGQECLALTATNVQEFVHQTSAPSTPQTGSVAHVRADVDNGGERTIVAVVPSIVSKGASALGAQDGGETSGTSTTAEQGLGIALPQALSMLSLYSSAGSELVSARSHAAAAAATESAGPGDDERSFGERDGATLARAGSLRSMDADEKVQLEADSRRSAQRSASSRSEGVTGDGSGESDSENNDASGEPSARAGVKHGPTKTVRVDSTRHTVKRAIIADDGGQDDSSDSEDQGATQAVGAQRAGLIMQSFALRVGEVGVRVGKPGMVAGMLKSLLKSSMQGSFQGRTAAPSVESAGTGVEAVTFEDLMSSKTRANLAWYFRPAVHRVALSIVLVSR